MQQHNDTSEEEKELTAKQHQAALLLAEGHNAVQDAEKTGVSRVTVERWKKLAPFQAAIHQAEDAIYDEALRLLKKTAKGAIVTLVACMDVKVSSYVRVQAAAKILEQGFQVHKANGLDMRLDRIEEIIKERLGEKL